MLMRLFRRLMPQEDRFIRGFAAHSRLVVQGAEAFRALLADSTAAMPGHYATLNRIEEEADAITHDTIQAIHRTFITPFDRSQILDLITGLDDILDLMKDAGRRVQRYGIGFTPEMVGMADCAVQAATALRDAMPLLDNIGRNHAALNAMQAEVGRAEGEADDLLDRGLRTLFAGTTSPGHKLTAEKIYDLIEAVVDRCEDVGDVVEGIVIEQV